MRNLITAAVVEALALSVSAGCLQADGPRQPEQTMQTTGSSPAKRGSESTPKAQDEKPRSDPTKEHDEPAGGKPDKTAAGEGADRAAAPVADLPLGAKAEVREDVFDDGRPRQLTEGYVDANGDFFAHGLVTKWYEETGTLHSKVEWRHGLPHGKAETWYYHGQLWTVGGYLEGREHGKWTKYHQMGEKQSEWTMDRGAWHGMYTEWHENGKKRLEVEFVHGLRQGPQKTYDEQGVLSLASDFVDGVEQP